MQAKLVELELNEINRDHERYERAHARLVVLAIGLVIGLVLALIALPMLLWPRNGTLRIVPSSLWPLAVLAAVYVAITLATYLQRQRAFRRVRQGCLKLRRAGYRISRQDVHFSGSTFGVTQIGQDDPNVLDVNRLSAGSLHAVMEPRAG